MAQKPSTLLQLQINELNRFKRSVADLLENLPEGVEPHGLSTAIHQADSQITLLETLKAEALAAEEAERLANVKKVTVTRNSWDKNDKVQVTLTQTSYSDSSWEVRLNGTLLGTIDNYTGHHSGWSASQGSRRATYRSRVTRIDAIRALLPRR